MLFAERANPSHISTCTDGGGKVPQQLLHDRFGHPAILGDQFADVAIDPERYVAQAGAPADIEPREFRRLVHIQVDQIPIAFQVQFGQFQPRRVNIHIHEPVPL